MIDRTPRHYHLAFSLPHCILHGYFLSLLPQAAILRHVCLTRFYLTVYIMQLLNLLDLLQQSKDLGHHGILIVLSWLLLFCLLTFLINDLFLTGLVAPMFPSYHEILLSINHFAYRSRAICSSNLACPTTLGLLHLTPMHPRHCLLLSE